MSAASDLDVLGRGGRWRVATFCRSQYFPDAHCDNNSASALCVSAGGVHSLSSSARKPTSRHLLFAKNGTPYLGPHHTTRVSDGGPDHPRFVGAVCLACHRELHFGMGGEEKTRRYKNACVISSASDGGAAGRRRVWSLCDTSLLGAEVWMPTTRA